MNEEKCIEFEKYLDERKKTNTRKCIKYTETEIDYILYKKSCKVSLKEISTKTNRTIATLKRYIPIWNKERYDYGTEDTQDEKYENNQKFYEYIKSKEQKPLIIADCYCGVKSWWKNNVVEEDSVITNDLNPKIDSQYHKESVQLLKDFKEEQRQIDIIDLDPFNHIESGELRLAIELATTGLIITFGDRRELKRKSERSRDRVKKICKLRYGIKKYSYKTIKRRISEIAYEFGKTVSFVHLYSTRGIWRLYCSFDNIETKS